MAILRDRLILWGSVGVIALSLGMIGVRVGGYNQVRQARFTVDVLQRYLIAYERVEDRRITRMEDLPDFHIVSSADSLSLRGADLRASPFRGGYIYDLRDMGDGKYVISASPVGLFTPRVEFGITEQGYLGINQQGTDPDPDGYDEVHSWNFLPSIERVRTASAPSREDGQP